MVGMTWHLESGTSILASTQPVTALGKLAELWLVMGSLHPLAREPILGFAVETTFFALGLSFFTYKVENTVDLHQN